MPLLPLLTRSTIARQRLVSLRRNTRITKNSASTSSNELQQTPSLRDQINFPSGGRSERYKLLEHWKQEGFSPSAGRLKDVYLLKKKEPQKYREWLEDKQRDLQRQQKYPLELKALGTRFQLELLRHLDDIEQALGYSFKSYDDILALFPRFHKNLRRDRIEDIYRAANLALLGKLALGLIMRNSSRWHRLDTKFLEQRGKRMRLDQFIIDPKTLEPQKGGLHTPKGELQTSTIVKRHGWKGSYIELALFGSFGAVFRDGGTDALETLLKHTNFLDRAQDRRSKLHEIGCDACQVLMTNSLYAKVKPDLLKQLIYIRCNSRWHAEISQKPDVSSFVDNYTFTNSSDKVDHIEAGGIGSLQDEWNRAKKDSEPAIRYQSFLGAAYRSGGLALVRNLLRSHDPGYACSLYPEKWQRGMLFFDQQKRRKELFW